MARIKLEARKFTIDEKCQAGGIIVDLSTGNPNVPGNEAMVEKFAEANEKLKQVRAEVIALQSLMTEKMAAQERAVKEWIAAGNALASYTESATGGNAVAMLSAGFGVRAERSRSQVPEQVVEVEVTLNGGPGDSELHWRPVRGAVGYLIESSEDPSAVTGWRSEGFSTRSKHLAHGATPGVVRWFRVSALNSEGQGIWSLPARRPVL